MDLGFSHGHSLIHRLDPRPRVAAALAFSAVVALSDRPVALWTALGVAVALAALARLGPRRLAWHLAVVNGFLALIWAVLPFNTPGETLFRLGGFAATREGVAQALAVTLKANAIVLACVALAATMDAAHFGQALHRMGIPEKLAHILLFTVRYFNVLHREYHRLIAATRVRCFRPRLNVHTCRTWGRLIGMLLVNSLDRADRVLAAMKCRGFDGKIHTLDRFAFRARDAAFCGAAGLVLLILGVLQWAPMAH